MKLKIAAIVAAALLSSPAYAEIQQWYGVSSGASSVRFVESTTRHKANGYIRAWLVSIYIDPLHYRGIPITAIKELREFDCNQSRSRTIQEILYKSGGKYVISREADMTWNYNSPGSIGMQVLDVSCGKEPPIVKLQPGFDPIVASDDIIQKFSEK